MNDDGTYELTDNELRDLKGSWAQRSVGELLLKMCEYEVDRYHSQLERGDDGPDGDMKARGAIEGVRGFVRNIQKTAEVAIKAARSPV